MADRILNLNQQIALLPAAIPDTVLDFLEDFGHATALSTEAARAAYDPEFLKAHTDAVKADLEKLRQDMGKLVQIGVEAAGRDIPGGFILKLTFEKGPRGVGLLTKLKERTILRVLVPAGEFNEPALKELLKNPPTLG
ncbi:MAG: hypothetical protein ACXVB9_22625 [Bdellovibrionota bacterium]